MLSPSFFNPIQVYKRKIARKLTGCISLYPPKTAKGSVLLSYVTHPFVITKKELDSSPHTNPWECLEIADIFLERGYAVDVIDWTDTSFKPKKYYRAIVDVHQNLERLSPSLPKDCIKIFYITGAEWSYQNNAEMKQLEEFERRTGQKLVPRRQIAPANNIGFADYATSLGNNFAKDTYLGTDKLKKPIVSIPLLSTVSFPTPAHKNFSAIKKNFVWIGGGGAIHKGLDRILECFKKLPDYRLTVCGPVESEKDFFDFYHKELYDTKNISFVGRVNVRGEQFKKITENSIGLIYPSISEGQAGSVITGLHAGLIPIVTYQSGVDVLPFGIQLKNTSIEEIEKSIKEIANLSEDQLKVRSLSAWNYAQKNHTKEIFGQKYAEFIDMILKENSKPLNYPLISVIIPCHNSEKTIGTAIESMLIQSYPHIEIVVVDDNSVDDTKNAVENLAKKYPNIFYYKLPYDDPHRFNKKGKNINAGYMARNFGFEKATGEWITFQDADDASLRNRIEVEYQLALKYKSSHVCVQWQQFQSQYMGRQLDIDRIFKDHADVVISTEEILEITRRSKGILMSLLGKLRSKIPFEIKTMRIINKLFFGSLESYPGSGNSPLFKRSVLEKVSFRALNERVWPSFTGRGADRDFNFQVAEIFRDSVSFRLPLYLWRVNRQNKSYEDYPHYIID